MERNVLRSDETEIGLADDGSVTGTRAARSGGSNETFRDSSGDQEVLESPFLGDAGQTQHDSLLGSAARNGANRPNYFRLAQRVVHRPSPGPLVEDTDRFHPNILTREVPPPEHEYPDANKITVVLDRTPAALVLHQFLNSSEMRQAALTSLLGKSARRTVHVHGIDIPIPAYLRVVSHLCREVAEQAETEDADTSAGISSREWRNAGRTEITRPNPVALDQNESQVAFDPFSPSQNIVTALSGKDWAQALGLAIQAGMRDENDLTNLIFFAKHPELPHEKLDPANPRFKQLAAEWSQILNDAVWTAIKSASENAALAVSGAEVCDNDRFYWGSNGKRLKQLVTNAAKEVDLNPGLLGTIIMSETRRPLSYLTTEKVSSYHIGTDDFYEGRAAIAARVPAYAKVHWDKTHVPVTHLNDATSPREVKTIFFDSGPDALLATAVYIKFREVRLREIAKDMNGDFDKLSTETRFALTRMAMAAGTAGATPALRDALAGNDIMVRKPIPVEIYQTKRNATVRTAQALHLSEWIFGIRVTAAQSAGTSGSSAPQHETNEMTRV